MFKNIKSLFIIEEEETPKKGQKSTKAKAETSKPTSEKVTPAAKVQSVEGRAGKVTKKFTDVLLKAMNENNLEGFDYLEYKQSLNSLKKMQMDEATRYQSAYAMAQTMGATPAHLVNTAQHYIDILQKEENKFEEALASQKNKQIGSKQQEIQKLDDAVKAKAQQIKKLTMEIEAHQKKSESLKKEISNASIKVENTKNDFFASFQNLVSQIKQDMENMKKYLK